MSAYLDCGMYLVFHGTVAYFVKQIDPFLSDYTLTPKFERITNLYMLGIQSLHLDWCKMKFFPKNQLLAENELTLSQIILFIFVLLLILNLELPARCNTSDETLYM